MNKKLLFIFSCLLMLCVRPAMAQCTIDANNTTNGFTPASLPCITQGTAYGQAIQLHVPATYVVTIPGIGQVTANVDSVRLDTITGRPSGINYSINPANRTIRGGQNGCIWFSGTTSAPVANYPLTFRAKLWFSVSGIGQTRDTTLNSLGYNYSLDVCAPQQTATCDTTFNISTSFLVAYPADTVITGGYLSGNNSFGDKAKAEKFTSTAGRKVTTSYFGFARAKDAGNADSVFLKLWDDTGASGAPGATLDSVKVPIALLAAAVTQQAVVVINWPKQPVLTTNAFFAGVVLPTNTGDTVVLLTDTIKQNGPGRGWEQWANNQWRSYNAAWLGSSAFQLGNAIGTITCANSNPNAKPAAEFSATPTTGCGSVTAQFTDASTNSPTSWSWTFTGGNPATSTDQNPVVEFTGSGAYTVRLIATNASGSDTITKTNYVNVTAPVLVTLTPTAASCNQSNGGATSNATGGTNTYTYLWSNGQTTANLTNVAAGTYTVTVNSGVCSATAGTNVNNTSTLNATTTSTPSSTSVSNNGQASVTATGGNPPYTYLWSNGATTAAVTNLAPGNYTVTVTDEDSCKSIKSVTVTFLVGLNDVNVADVSFKVSPNPTYGTIRMDFNQTIEAEGAVYGVDGKLYQTFAVNNQIEVLNIANLPSGVYIVQVRDRNSISTAHTRIVKY